MVDTPQNSTKPTKCYKIIFIILLFWEFVTLASADGLSLESE